MTSDYHFKVPTIVIMDIRVNNEMCSQPIYFHLAGGISAG